MYYSRQETSIIFFPIKKSFRHLLKSRVEWQQDPVVKAADNVSFVFELDKVLVIEGASGSRLRDKKNVTMCWMPQIS